MFGCFSMGIGAWNCVFRMDLFSSFVIVLVIYLCVSSFGVVLGMSVTSGVTASD